MSVLADRSFVFIHAIEGHHRKTGAHFIGEDSQPGRRLRPYSRHSTLLQLFVSGEGIDLYNQLFAQPISWQMTSMESPSR